MPQRKAVVIGINDYQGTINDLPSCVADATTFKRLLETRFGFAPQDVHILTDAQATVAAAGQQLDWLFLDAAPADRLVLFYSGHGYQQAKNGVREEYLVLYDGLFQDDELSRRTQPLPPGVLTVVLDSCFSGGMEKLVQLLAPEWTGGLPIDPIGLFDSKASAFTSVLSKGNLKVWTPPDFKQLQADLVAARQATRVKPFGRGVLAASRAGRKSMVIPATADEAGQVPMRGLLVSACLEDETAAASTPATAGLSAFTYSLTRILANTPAALSTKNLIAKATLELRMIGVGQTPQIKEPVAPPASSSLSFIDMMPVQKSDESPDGDSTSPLLEMIARLFGKEQSMSSIDPSILLQLMAMGRQDGANKGVPEDIARALGVILPLLKGQQAAPANKSFADLLPVLLPLVLKGSAGQDKGWFDDALRVISVVGPLIKGQQAASKSIFDCFPPPIMSDLFKSNAADKGWLDDALRVITVVGPLLKGQSQNSSSQKGWVDFLPLIPILLA